MRASLFLSALFCASLIGGTAAAEKPEKERPQVVKEPKLSALRSKGDMLERHTTADKTKETYVAQQKVDRAATPLKIRQAAERIRCSEAQEDCGRGTARNAGSSKADKTDKSVATKGSSNDTAKMKAMVQKMMSSKCGARARGGCDGHDDPY